MGAGMDPRLRRRTRFAQSSRVFVMLVQYRIKRLRNMAQELARLVRVQLLSWDSLRLNWRMNGLDKKRSGMRSEEQTSELQSLMRISSAVFCLQKIQISLHRT